MQEILLMSVREAADALGLGLTKTWGLISEKRLEAVKVGRRTLVRRDSLLAFAKEGSGPVGERGLGQ